MRSGSPSASRRAAGRSPWISTCRSPTWRRRTWSCGAVYNGGSPWAEYWTRTVVELRDRLVTVALPGVRDPATTRQQEGEAAGGIDVVVSLGVETVKPGEADGVARDGGSDAEHAEDGFGSAGPEGQEAPIDKHECDEGLGRFKDGNAAAKANGLSAGAGGIEEEEQRSGDEKKDGGDRGEAIRGDGGPEENQAGEKIGALAAGGTRGGKRRFWRRGVANFTLGGLTRRGATEGTEWGGARGRAGTPLGAGQGRAPGRGGEKGKDADKNKGGDRPRGGFFRRRRVCKFCAEKIDYINYKDVRILAPFLPERGKIQPRRISGTCAMHQRKLQTAIKRARQLALIPYVTD